MKNDIKVEDLYKALNRYRTLNSLNKQVLVCITLETMRLVFNQYWRYRILITNRNEIDRQQDSVHENPSYHQIEHETQRDNVQNDRVQEMNDLINETDKESIMKSWRIYLTRFYRIWNTVLCQRYTKCRIKEIVLKYKKQLH